MLKKLNPLKMSPKTFKKGSEVEYTFTKRFGLVPKKIPWYSINSIRNLIYALTETKNDALEKTTPAAEGEKAVKFFN